MGKEKEQQDVCGACAWFYGEDVWGFGSCALRFFANACCEDSCVLNDQFVSKQQQRHYVAVLLQFNRYRRDNNFPAIYRTPQPKDLGDAIDFAAKYIKTFMKL